ncbi:hypothetical protein ROJ8625_02733 [Roseivivax jejudonensis]|uniref:Uncharacterized protein n=1 Tax=Roseivivax jejudonensis TaxID=1529041 RepID=A0A1X6ZJH7_9RHOB|nr:hypothetical protein [Roseivivax jejudonensis]SLN53399.1 hypothetical protein ROJ8625_02733 [Roseivivax jejudonensis]
MSDRFQSYVSGLESPATDLLEIFPSDDSDLPHAVRALSVAQSGSVRVETVGGSVASVFVAAGAVMPVRVRRVFATGTDALGITGLI